MKKENISDYLKINDKYGITYELENSDVIKIDKDVIAPLKIGDVTSEKYNIDDKTKTIDLNEIKLGIDSLVKEVIKNKLYIKDGSGNIVDEYTLVNKKEDEKENTKVVINEKVVEKIAYKSNNLTLIIINIIEGILLLVLAILFIKSMRKNKN